MGDELFDQLNQLKQNEVPRGVATLVNTRGTTPGRKGPRC